MENPAVNKCHPLCNASISSQPHPMLVTLRYKTNASESPMNWYYSVEGRSHGPVSQQDMLRLAKEGVVNTDTLIWHPGLDEWDPVWKLMPQAMEHMSKSAMAK